MRFSHHLTGWFKRLNQYQNGPSNIGGSGSSAGVIEPSGYFLWRDSRLRAASTSWVHDIEVKIKPPDEPPSNPRSDR
jgi:hypothetical protein